MTTETARTLEEIEDDAERIEDESREQGYIGAEEIRTIVREAFAAGAASRDEDLAEIRREEFAAAQKDAREQFGVGFEAGAAESSRLRMALRDVLDVAESHPDIGATMRRALDRASDILRTYPAPKDIQP